MKGARGALLENNTARLRRSAGLLQVRGLQQGCGFQWGRGLLWVRGFQQPRGLRVGRSRGAGPSGPQRHVAQQPLLGPAARTLLHAGDQLVFLRRPVQALVAVDVPQGELLQKRSGRAEAIRQSRLEMLCGWF